jgi:hypothetical protein
MSNKRKSTKSGPTKSEYVKAREELIEMGPVRDSGRRENGQIVWEIVPLKDREDHEQKTTDN